MIPKTNSHCCVALKTGLGSEYIDRKDNVIAVGNSGAGKTHIAPGLGLAAGSLDGQHLRQRTDETPCRAL